MPSGVTLFEGGSDVPLDPAAFVATTVKVYAVPFLSPVIVALVGGEMSPMRMVGLTITLMVPGFDVTVYSLIGTPPFDAGAVHDTVAWVSPAIAVMRVGASGGLPGVHTPLAQ